MMNFEVEVKVSDILNVLYGKKEEHETYYTEALAVFYNEMTHKAEEAYNRILKADYSFVQANFGLVEPVNCSKNYQDMIDTFDMINTETIKMPVDQLKSIMSNDWVWLNNANTVNAIYSTSLKKLIG